MCNSYKIIQIEDNVEDEDDNVEDDDDDDNVVDEITCYFCNDDCDDVRQYSWNYLPRDINSFENDLCDDYFEIDLCDDCYERTTTINL